MRKFAYYLCMIIIVAVLSGCGYTEEDLASARSEGVNAGYEIGYKHGYSKGYEDGNISEFDMILDRAAKRRDADKSTQENNPTTQPEPESGTILSGTEYSASEITVTADSGSSCVVLLKSSGGLERLSFYVRAGDTVTVGVPAEYLYVYFASGNSWYGYGEGLMFGSSTAYSKDDEMIDFAKYTWEYTLYPTYNGNFSETPSNENEFFG